MNCQLIVTGHFGQIKIACSNGIYNPAINVCSFGSWQAFHVCSNGSYEPDVIHISCHSNIIIIRDDCHGC